MGRMSSQTAVSWGGSARKSAASASSAFGRYFFTIASRASSIAIRSAYGG